MTFASNGAAVLSELLRSLGGIHIRVQDINREWQRMRPLMLGALGVVAGSAALKGIWDIVKASKELNDELERTKNLGDSPGGTDPGRNFASRLAEERAAAFRIQQAVPTGNFADYVKMHRELSTQLSSIDEASDVGVFAAKFAWDVGHFTGKEASPIDMVQKAVKIAETLGKATTIGPDGKPHFSAASLKEVMEATQAAVKIAGGMLSVDDLLAQAKQAAVPGRLMDIRTYFTGMAELALAQGARPSGTAMTGFYQQLVGGTMTRRTAEEMQRHHMLNAGEWKSKDGHIVVAPEARKRLQNLATDPFNFITNTLLPELEKEGIKGKDAMAVLLQLFGRQTVQRLVADIASNPAAFARAKALFDQQPGVEKTYDELQNNNLTTNITALNESWKSLMQTLGDAGVPLAISVLHGLTEAVQFMAATAEAHSHLAEWLLGIGGALSLLAVVGGGFAALKVSLWGLSSALKSLAASGALFAEGAAAAVGLARLAGLLSGLATAGLAVYGLIDSARNYKPAPPGGVDSHGSPFPSDRNLYGPGNPPAPAIPNMTVRPEKQSWLMDPAAPENLARSIAEHIVAGLRGGGPLPVDVANAGEVGGAAGKAAATGAFTRLTAMVTRPPTGPTGGDFRTAQSYPSRLASA